MCSVWGFVLFMGLCQIGVFLEGALKGILSYEELLKELSLFILGQRRREDKQDSYVQIQKGWCVEERASLFWLVVVVCVGLGRGQVGRSEAALLWGTETAAGGIQLYGKKLSSNKTRPTVNDRIVRGQVAPWQWDCRKDSNAWRLSGLLFSSISPAIQRLILKPLPGHFLDFKLSCSDLAESGSTLNGLVDVVICLVYGDPWMKVCALPTVQIYNAN